MATNRDPLVSIILVNHNGKHFLNSCLSSIQKQDHKNIEILFVDNDSTDDSVTFVKNTFPNSKIIKNDANLGYAGGTNKGVSIAKGEYILVLNNDTVLEPNVISTLLNAYKEIPNLGAVQPMIKLLNRDDQIDACGSFWTDTGFNYHYGIYKSSLIEKYNKSFPVYSLKGVCMLIPKKLIDLIGMFDEDYWCYFEETDFCHRVWLAGYECWYYPKAFMYHHLGGTRLGKKESFIQYHSFKNRLKSYLKNLGSVEIMKVIPVYLLLTIAYGSFFLLKRNITIIAVIKAFIWNVIHFRKIRQERVYIQKVIRKQTDQVIFSKVRKNPRISYYFSIIKGLYLYED